MSDTERKENGNRPAPAGQDHKRSGGMKGSGAGRGPARPSGTGRTARSGGKPFGRGKTFGGKAKESPRRGEPGKTRTPGKTAEGARQGDAHGRPAGAGQRAGFHSRPADAGQRAGFHGRPAGAPYGRPAPKKAPEMEGLAARRTALKVLRAVTEEGAYASLVLDKVLQGSGMSGADRRLVSRLVYDTLDNLQYLDHMLGQVMAREDTDIKLRNILRLGACQILLEDRIPESAATNTCVQLCTECGMEGLKGVCNGILRNLVRKKDELTLPDPAEEPDRYFAVKYSLPEWLGRRLRQDWGEETAREMAAWRNTDSAVTIRRNLLKTDGEGFRRILEKKIWGKEEGDLPGAWRIRGAMDLARDADYLGGQFSIQSESSMMACLAVGVRRGMQVLDCCAAPGGKTCYLSELMGDTGRVQAWDLHEHRVQLIASQQKRLGLENIRPRVLDAAKYREEMESTMDAVLLDAPCSGLGVLAEKPDIKLRVTEESVAELTALQARLLDTVCRYVKPGGVLVYSTCSLLKDENERQISAFLERHPEYSAEALPESIPARFRAREQLGLQLIPHRDGVEGFYICRMRRKDEM